MKSIRYAAIGLVTALVPAMGIADCRARLAEVQPIFNANCVACHQDAAPGGGLSLQRASAFDMLVGAPSTSVPEVLRIAPGLPDESLLWLKINNRHDEVGAAGTEMPPGATLAEAERALIEGWITTCEAG